MNWWTISITSQRQVIFHHSGKGECKLSYNFTDCEGEITGECDCNIVKPNQESLYNGTFCDCCKNGPCQTHCFNRYAPKDGGEEYMCSKSGKCSCYERSVDAKQRVGEKCKVRNRRFLGNVSRPLHEISL